jgi:hypothetical protein
MGAGNLGGWSGYWRAGEERRASVEAPRPEAREETGAHGAEVALTGYPDEGIRAIR